MSRMTAVCAGAYHILRAGFYKRWIGGTDAVMAPTLTVIVLFAESEFASKRLCKLLREKCYFKDLDNPDTCMH